MSTLGKLEGMGVKLTNTALPIDLSVGALNRGGPSVFNESLWVPIEVEAGDATYGVSMTIPCATAIDTRMVARAMNCMVEKRLLVRAVRSKGRMLS